MSPPTPPAAASSPGSPVPAWLRGLPRAPEYRPTESEFADPIAFLSRVEREAASYGICKVIPPYPRPSRRFVFNHLNRSLVSSDALNRTTSASFNTTSPQPPSSAVFTTRHQELGTPRRGRPPPQVLKQVWQSGECYTLEQFEAKSRAFSKIHLSGVRDPIPLTVESLFWKASANRPIYIEYANDVPGSGFAASAQSWRQKKQKREGVLMDEGEKTAGWRLSSSPWNLQAIARAPGSLTRFMPDDVPGVTSPMVYIGMLFSWFAWHVEDHELHSLNFLHTGAPKTWYAVPGDRAAELEEVIRVRGYGGNPDHLASLAVLGEKTTLMSPEVLVASGLPCCRLVQYPGEFVVTFPRAYHVGFSHGFNCGEAANFATPQWLKFAKEAAVRRAVMNYLPMLSHQQLLYLLAASFISRTPRELLSGIRTSRLRDRRKEERELLVKQEFLQDMISENELLCSFLKKKSIDNAVLWEPDMLPSSIALHSCSSGPKAYEKKSDGGYSIESIQCNRKDNSSSDGRACMAGTQPKCMSMDSKPSSAMSVSEEEKLDADADDQGDLPFDLSIDSGSLTCVACGILGYPLMAVLQPSRKALEEMSVVDRERFKLNCEKENHSNVRPCSPNDENSGCLFIANRPSSPEEHANFSHQNEKSHKVGVSLMEKELDEALQQHSNSSHSCSSENTLIPCMNTETSEKKVSGDSFGSELSKQTGRGEIDAQALESCANTIKWNITSAFARPRIFCLKHALEIEELLEGKGGAHAIIICHSDYIKLKALAISIAEEIEFQFDCKDVPLANASKSDLHLINISIDDEGHEEDGRDWTSQMGLNLKYYAKLRKETSGCQEQPPLSFWGQFSKPSPTSVVSNLKWLCRKARTPYKVVGFVSSSNAAATPEKVNTACTKDKMSTSGNAYENDKSQQSLQQGGLLEPSRLQEPEDVADTCMCSEENGQDGHCLVDIPIALAEYPMMHQVCEGPVSVNTCDGSVCSLNPQDSLSLAAESAEFTIEQRDVQLADVSSSVTVFVQQFLDNERINEEGSMNIVKHESLDSRNVTLECKDKQLQVQQDQENIVLCDNPNRNLVGPCLINGVTVSEEPHEYEGNCAKRGYFSDIVFKNNKSTTDNQPGPHDPGAALVMPKSSCDMMISSLDRLVSLPMVCLASTNAPCSMEPLSVAHDLTSDELQAIRNSKMPIGSLNPVQVDISHSNVEAIKLNSNNSSKLQHEYPKRDDIVSEDVQAASTKTISREDGKSVYTESNSFDILLGVLAEESKLADAPGKDEVGKASLTLMTLASNDYSTDDVTQGEVVEVAGSSISASLISGASKKDQCVDWPRDLCVSDVASRSIGTSNRTDIICYVRRKHKRKRKLEFNTDSSQSCGSFIRSPCESLRPRTKPAVVEETAKKSKTVEASAANKGKRTKVGPFQCDIEFCDMIFETRAELRAHERNICIDESCGKRFKSHKYLKRHQCVHSDERPFKCPWDGCRMTFKWLWAQTEHVRVHTGERPYKCSAPDCGQRFRYVSDYSRHRKKFNHY